MDNGKRFSILKPNKFRNSIVNDEEDEESPAPTPGKQPRISMRRVSFASSNFIKEFAADSEKLTIWNTTYEETIDKSDSTQSLQNTLCMQAENLALGNSNASINLERATEQTINFQALGGEDILLDTTLINIDCDDDDDDSKDNCNKENEPPKYKVSDMDFTQFVPFKEKTIVTDAENKTQFVSENLQLTCQQPILLPIATRRNKTIFGDNMELVVSSASTPDLSLGTSSSDKSMELTLPIGAEIKTIPDCDTKMELTTFSPNAFKSELQAGTSQNASIKEKSFCNNEKIQDKSINPVVPMASQNSFRASKDALLPPKETTLNPNLTSDKHDTSIITHNKSKSLSFQQCETKNNTLDTDINVCKLPKIKIKAQSRQTSKTTNNMSVFVPDISITNFKKCASSTIIMGSVASNVSLKISEYSKLEMSDTNACKKIAQSDEMGVLKHMSANNSSVNISRKRASTTTLDRESKLASFESRSKIPTPVKDSSPSSKCFNNSQKLQSSLSASALQQSFLKQTSCSSKILFTPQPSTVTNLSCNGSRAGLGSDRAPNMTLDNLFVLQKTADTAGFVSNVSGCKETNVHAFSVQESCTVTGNDAPNESAKGLIEQKSLSTNIVNNYTLDVKSIREESAVNVSESLIGKVQVSQNLEIEDSVVRHANSIITGIWTKGGITNRSVDVSENVNIPGDSQHHELLLSQVVLNTSNIDSTCDGVKACASTLLNEHQKTNTKPDVDISIPDVSTCQISVNVNIDQTSKSTIFVPDTNLQHETSEPSHETNLKYTKDNQSCLCNDSANMSFVNKSGLLRSFAHTSSTRQTGEAILPTTNMVAETIKGVTSSYCGDSPKATCTNVCLSSSTSTCQTDEVILPTLNMLDETVMGATNSYRVDSPKATCDINVCLSSNMSAQKSLLSNTVGADITLERSLPQIDNIIDSTSSIIEIHSTENNCTPPLETNLSVKAEIAHTNVDVNSFIYVGKQTQASDIKSKGDFLENFHVPIQVLNGTLNAMILSPTNDIQEIPTNDSLLSQSIITICDESVADDVNLIDAPLQGTTLNDNQEVSIIDTNLNMQGAPIDNDPICVVASLNEDIITSDANVEQQIFADSNSDAEIIKPTIADVTQFINADISKRKDASLVTEHNLETTQNHCKVVVKKEISTVDEKNVTINEANDISKQFAPQNANQQESMLRLELSNIIRPKNINNVSDVNDKVIDTSFDKSLYPGLKNLELNKDSSFAQFLPFSSTAISKTTLNIDVSAAEAHSNLDTTGKPNNSFTLVTDVETQAQPQTTFVQESTKTQTLLPFTEKTTNTDISVADAQLITDKTTDKVIQNWSSNRNTTLQNSNIIHDGNFKNDIRASQIVPNVSSNVSKQAIVPLTDRILSSVLGETLINVDKSNNENVQNKTGDFLQLVCGPTTPDESVKHDDLVQPESLKIVQGIGEQSILPPLERILSVDKTNNDYTQSKVSNESVELVSCSLSQKLNVTPAVKFENSIKADSTLPQFVTGKQIITPLVDRIQNDSVSATTHNDDGPKNINVQSNTCNNSQSLVSCPANATSHNSNIEDDIIENVIETKSVFQQLVSSKQTISSFSENSLNIDHTKTETVRRRSSIALLQFVLSSTTNLRDPTLQNSNINEDVKLENDQTDESISHTMKQTILSPPKTTLNVDVSLETQLNLDVTNKPSDASKESLQVAPCSSISISKTTLENSNASVLPENVLQESRQFDEKSISVNVSAVEILNCGSSIVLRNHEDVAVNPDNKIKINNTCNTNIPCNLSNDCQETLAPSLTQVAFKSIVHLDESSNIIKQAEKNLERDVTIFDNELNLPNESIDGVGQETTTGTEPYTNVNQNEAQFLKTETLETNNLTNYITENVSVSNTSQIKANDCMEPNDRASQTLTPSPNIGNYDGNTLKQNMSVLADINLTAMKENSSSAEGDYNAIKVSTPLKTNVSQNDDDNWTDISVTEEQEDYQKDNKNVNAIEFMDCDEVKTPTASSVNITLRNKTKPEFYRNIQTDMDTDDDFEMSNDDVTIDSFFKSPRYQTQGVSQVLNNTHVPVPENTFQSFSEKNVNELQALTINTPRTASNTTQIKLVVPDNSNLEPDSKSNGISPTRITMHDVDEYFREMEDKHLSVPDFNVSKTCEPEPVVFASESLCSTNVNALEILSKTTARELKTDTVTKPENNMKIFADTNFTTPINIYKTKTSDLELTTKPVCDFSIDVSPGKIATPNIVQPSPANVFKLSLCTTLTDSKTNIDSISEKTDKFAVKTRENDVLNESLFKRNTSPNQLGNKTAEDNDCEAEKVDRSIKTSISDGKLCDNSVLKNLSIKNWTYTKQTAKDNKQEDTMDIDLFNLPNVPACNDLSLWKHNSNANMSHYPNISMASFNAPSHFGNETEASTTMDKVLKTTYTIGKKSDAKNQRLDFKTPKRSVTPFHQNIISFSPCIDDTQHLINLNLENRKFSDNSKSDFSKIIAGETPLCMSRRFMPLGDFNNSAFPTSLENTREETNIDDEQLKYDIKQLTNSYKDDKTNNISEESLELHTTINDTFTPIATATQNTIPAGTRGIGYISESSVDELLIESMSDKFEHFEEEMKIKFSRIAVACAKFKNQQNEILKNIRKKNLMRTAVFAEIQINDTPDSCDFSLDCTMDNVEKELVRFEVPSGIELERIVTMKEKIEEKLKREFAADSEKLTIWNTTYEETIDKSDSTQSLQNTLCMQAENLALGNSNASINLERATEQTINFQALGGEDILLDTTLINIDCDDDDDDSKDNCNKENEPPKYKVSDMDFTQFVPFKEKTIVTDAENKTQFVSENLQLTCQQPILLPIATRRNKTIFGDNMELVVSSASTPDLSLGTSSSDKSMELTLPIGAEIKTIPDCDTKMELTTFSPNAFKSELQAGTSQNASIKEKSFCNNEKIQDKSINPVVPMASQNSFRASKDALLPPKETTLNPNLTSDKHDTSIITHNKSKSLSFQQCETKNNTLDTDINVCKLPKIKIKAQSRQTSKTTNNMSVFVPDISITNFKKCASSTIIMGSVASNVSLKISEYSKLEMSDTNACKKIAQSDEMGVLKHMSANNSSVNISRKRASTTTLDRESKLASFESRSKIPTPVKDSSPSSKCFNNSQKLQSSLSASALQQSFLKQTSCSSKILFTPQPSTVTNLSCNGSRAGLGSDRAPNMTLDNLFVLQKTADTAGFVSNVSGCKETNVHAFSVQESCTVTGNDAPNESAKGLIEQKSLSTNIVNNYTLDVKSIREESAVNVSESLIGKVQVSQNLEIEDSVVCHANSIITGIWTKGGITNRSVDVSENVNKPGDSQHHELLLSQVVLNTSNIDSTCDGVKACASTLLNEHQKTNTKPDVDISIPDVSTCQISVNVNIDQTSKSTIFVPDTNLQHVTSEPSHETNLKYTKDNQSSLCNDSANMSFVNKSGLLRSFAHTSSTRQTGEAILPTTNMIDETIKGVTSSYCGDSPKATCRTNVCLSSSTSTCQTDEVILPTLNMLDETVMGATNSYRVDSPKATCDINVCLSSNMSAQKSLLSNTVGADITLGRSLPQIDNIIDLTSSIIEVHSTEHNCTPPLETNLSAKAEIAHTNVDVNSSIYVGKQTQASDIKSKDDFLENLHVPIEVIKGTLNTSMIVSPTNDIQEIQTNDRLLSQSIITICDESVADDVNLIDTPLQGTLNVNQEVSIIDTNLNVQGAPIDDDPICVVASLNEDIITSDANVEQQIFADSNSDAEIIKLTIADVTQFINADISKRKDASLVTEHNLETTQNHCKVVVKKEISTVDEKNVTINEANDISKQFAPQNANQQESMLRLELSNIIRPKNINNVSDVNDKVIDTSFDKSLYPGLKNLELNKDSSFAQFLPFSSTAISKTTLNIDVSAAEAHSNLDTTGKPNNSFTLVTDVETQAQPQTTFVQESTKTQTLLPFTEKTTNTDISVADAQLITDKTTDKVIQNWSSNRNTTLQNSNIIHDGNFKNDIRASQIVPNVSSNVSKQAIVPLTDRILSSVLGETQINVDKSNNENVQNKTGDFLQLVCGPTTPDESVKHDDLVQPESLKIVQGIGEQSILPPLERILSVDKTNNDYTQSKVSNESVELVSCSLSQKLNVTPAVKFENSIKADSTLPQFVTGKQIITPLVDRIQNDSVSATTHNDDGPKNINVQSNTCNNSQSLVSCPANATSHNSNIEDDIIENVIETKSVFQQLVSSKQTISSFSENSLNIDHTKTETVRRRSSIALLQFVLSSTTNVRDSTLQNSNINEDVKLENDQTDESISHTMKQTILSPPKTTLNVDVSLETQLNLDVTNKPSDASKESLQVAPCSSISISKTTLENSNASVLPENVLQESRQFDEKSISVNVSAVEILNCGSSIVLRNHEDVAVNPDNKIKINNTCNTNIPCNLSNDCQETLAPSLTQVAFKSIVHLDESSNIIKQAEKNLERDVTIFDNELNLPNESIDGVGQETTTGTEPYTNVNQNEAQFLKTETLETNNLTNYITENVSVSNTSQIKANDCMEPNDRASQTLTPSPNIGNYDGNTSKQNMSVLADINLTAMKENSSSAKGDYNAIKVSTPLKTNVSQNDDDNWTDISVTEEQEDYQKDNKNVNAIEFMDCDEVKTPTASSVNITLRNKTKPEFYRNIQTDMDTDDDFEMSNDDVTIDSFFKSPRYQTQGVSQVLNNTHVPVPENTFQSFSEKNVNELQALTINTPRTASNTTQIKLVVPDNSNLEPDSKSNGISPTRITMHDVDEYFREMEDKHLSVPDFNVSKTCEPEPVVFASESLCSTNVNALEILSKTTARELKTDTVTKPENNMKIFADTNFTTPINIYKTKTSDLELTTKPVCDFSIDVSPGKIASPNIVQPSPANVFKLSLCTTLTDSKTNIDSISEKTDKFAVKTRENDVLNESLFKRNTSPNQLGNKTAEDNDCEAEKVDRSIKTSISDGKLCDNSVLKNLSIKNWTYTKQTAKDNKQEDTMDIDLFNLPNVPACNDLSLWKHNSNANMSHYPNISMASFNAPSHFGNETEASTTMDKVLKTTYTIGKKSDAKNQRLDFKTPKRSVTPFHQNIISFSPCIDDTQHLINLNLENRKFSDNSKSDFSKIIAGETPLCMSRRFMPLGDFNNSAFPTSLENTREETNIDDEQLKYDIKQLTNSYKDDKTNNISEESLELHTTINDTFTPIATATQNTIPAGTRGIGYISESSVDELLIESMSDKFEHFEEEMKIKFSRIAVACAKFKNQQNEILKNIRKKNLMRTAVFAEIQINDTPDSCDFSLDCTMDNVEKELVRFEVPSGIELERIVTMKEKIEEKLKSSKGYWNIISIHANELKLATLFNTIHLSVCFNTETGVVNTIEKSYKISEKSHTQAIYVHELLKSRLSTASIQSAIGERFDVLSLIDFICINMRKMLDILKEFDKLEDKFGFKIAQSLKIATFKVFSLVRVSAWTICLDITDLNNMTGDAVSASAECGVVNESDIKNLVKNCRKGLLFFNDFTYKVHLHSKLAYNK